MIRRFGEFMGNVPYKTDDTKPNLRENAGPNPPGTRALRSGESAESSEYNRPHAAHVANTDYLDWLLTQEIAVPTSIGVDLAAAISAGAVSVVSGAHEIDLSHSFFDTLFPSWSNGRVYHGDIDTADALAHFFSIYDEDGMELCDFGTGAVRVYGVSLYASYGNPVGAQIAIAGPSLIAETRRHGIVVPPAIYEAAQPGDVIELTNAGLINTGQYAIRRVNTLTGFIELMGFSTDPETDDEKASPTPLDPTALGEATLRSSGRSTYRPTVRLSGQIPSAYLDKTVTLVLGIGMRFPIRGDSITTLGVQSAPPMVWAVLKRFMDVTWESITSHTPYEIEPTTLEKANTDLLASNLQTAYDQSLGKGNSNDPGTGRQVTVTDGPVQLDVEPSISDGHHTGISVREDHASTEYSGLNVDIVNRTLETLPFLWRERVTKFTVTCTFMGSSNYISAPWANTSPVTDVADVKEDRESPLGDGIQSLVPYLVEIPVGNVNQGLYMIDSAETNGFYVKTLWGDSVSFDAGTCSDVVVYAIAAVANWLGASLTAVTEEAQNREIGYRAIVDKPEHSGFAIDKMEAEGAGTEVRLLEGTGRGHLTAGGYEREDQSVIGATDQNATDSTKKPAAIIRASLPNCQYNSRRAASIIELPAHTEAQGEGGFSPWSPIDGFQIRSHITGSGLGFTQGVNLLSSGNIQTSGVDFSVIFATTPWVKPGVALEASLGCDYYVELFGCEDERDCGIYRVREVVSSTTLKLSDPITGDQADFYAPYGGGSMRLFARDLSFRSTGDLIDHAYIRMVLPSQSSVSDAQGIVVNALDPLINGAAILIRGRHYRVSTGSADGSLIRVETDQRGNGIGSCYEGVGLSTGNIEAIYRAAVESGATVSKGAFYALVQAVSQKGLHIDLLADPSTGILVESSGSPVFRVRRETAGTEWIEYKEAYAIENIGTTTPTAYHKMAEENILGYIDYVLSGVIWIPVHRDIITVKRESGYTEDGTSVVIGHEDHRTVTTMAENPEGEGRRNSGKTTDRPLDKQPVFPFWAGDRPYEDRIVPMPISGYYGENWARLAGGSVIAPFVQLTTSLEDTPLLLPIKADPGAVIMGARAFLAASTATTWPINMTVDLAIYRENPMLWPSDGDVNSRNRMDGRIGYIPYPTSLSQAFCNASLHSNTAVLGPPAGPRSVSLSVPDPTTIGNNLGLEPLEVDLLDTDGDPVWISLPGTGTTVRLVAVDGTDRVYRAKSSGFGSYGPYIRAHQPGGATTIRHLRNLSMPFVGDYLWIGESTSSGLYPIVNVEDDSGDLCIDFITDEIIDEVDNVPFKVPAILNPGAVAYLYFNITDQDSANQVGVYPGIAYIKSYNDLSAAGFPFSPTNATAAGGGRFPYSPT